MDDSTNIDIHDAHEDPMLTHRPKKVAPITPQVAAHPPTPPPTIGGSEVGSNSAGSESANKPGSGSGIGTFGEQKKESLYTDDARAYRHMRGSEAKLHLSEAATEFLFGPDGKPKSGVAKLAQILMEKQLVTFDQIQVALREQKKAKNVNKMLGAILVELGFITEITLAEILSESSGIKKVDLSQVILDPKLIEKVPKEVAQKYKVIPLTIKDNVLSVAINDIYNVMAVDQIRRFFAKNIKIETAYAIESQIIDIIDKYYQYDLSIEGILKEIETGITEKKQISGETIGYTNPTVRLVDAILVDAVKSLASDIHLEPEENFVRLRLRIDGEMVQTRSFHKEYWQAIAIRLKIMAAMNIAESRMPQDGRITMNILGREIDFRVATQPTINGENIVLRILDKKQSLVELSKLGFSPSAINTLKKVLHKPEGIIIVTGPTGSGKTTTLYSVLSYINSVTKNIMTLEDPVEYQLPMIRQSNIRATSGITYSDGIKSLLRQDPDIIFVGEVRDESTAKMAIRAALTGHQVFTTLHANDAFGAIPRLVDIGISPTLIADVLVCVMAQRLARLLCKHCREEVVANERECRILNADIQNPPTIYEHRGCELCNNSGYSGRVAICEVLAIDKELGELMQLNSTSKKIFDHARAHGFKTMLDDGVEKVLKGFTDIAELISTIDVTDRL